MNCELTKCVHARVCCLQGEFFDAGIRIATQHPLQRINPGKKWPGDPCKSLLDWVYAYCQERSQPAETQGGGQTLHTATPSVNAEAALPE